MEKSKGPEKGKVFFTNKSHNTRLEDVRFVGRMGSSLSPVSCEEISLSIKYRLATRRLIVRPLRLSDYSTCLKTKARSTLSEDEATGNFIAISQADKAAFRHMIAYRSRLMHNDQAYVFGLFEHTRRRFIGEAMLYNVKRKVCATADVGLLIHSPYRRRGYGGEALCALLRFGQEKLGLLTCEGLIDARNRPSLKLCSSVGFLLVHRGRRAAKYQGQSNGMLQIRINLDGYDAHKQPSSQKRRLAAQVRARK